MRRQSPGMPMYWPAIHCPKRPVEILSVCGPQLSLPRRHLWSRSLTTITLVSQRARSYSQGTSLEHTVSCDEMRSEIEGHHSWAQQNGPYLTEKLRPIQTKYISFLTVEPPPVKGNQYPKQQLQHQTLQRLSQSSNGSHSLQNFVLALPVQTSPHPSPHKFWFGVAITFIYAVIRRRVV